MCRRVLMFFVSRLLCVSSDCGECEQREQEQDGSRHGDPPRSPKALLMPASGGSIVAAPSEKGVNRWFPRGSFRMGAKSSQAREPQAGAIGERSHDAGAAHHGFALLTDFA